MKIVINKCYGGFSLSNEAIKAYASRKGITLYPEADRYGLTIWWTVPPDQRPREVSPEEWYTLSLEERKAINEAHNNSTLRDREIPRNDPDLVAVVEAGGANGRHAQLAVVEIPDDVKWQIEEYDGLEWIAEQHRTWS